MIWTPPPLPPGMTEAQREALWAMARDSDMIAEQMIRSMQGADQVDSERYYGISRVYLAVARGVPFEDAFTTEDNRWRAFAVTQNAKVNAAPKIKRGPSSGHSVISHRWADPDRFVSGKSHVAFMVRKALGMTAFAYAPGDDPAPPEPPTDPTADMRGDLIAVLYGPGGRMTMAEAADIANNVAIQGPHVVAPYGIKVLKAALKLWAAVKGKGHGNVSG